MSKRVTKADLPILYIVIPCYNEETVPQVTSFLLLNKGTCRKEDNWKENPYFYM